MIRLSLQLMLLSLLWVFHDELQKMEENDLMARYGSMGRRLSRLSRGLDSRHVEPVHEAKSISAETTFMRDITNAAELDRILWPLCEKVATRAKASGLAGSTVVLKLKTADFKIRTRNQTLPDPTQLAEVIYRVASPMLKREATGTSFRLLGVGISGLADGDLADPPDMLDPAATRRAEAERAMDRLRAKFGDKSIVKGRGMGGDKGR